MRRRRTTLAATAAALAVLAGACTSGNEPGKVLAEPGDRGVPEVTGVDFRLASALRPFDACGDFLDHVRTEALAHPGAGGLFPPGWNRRGDVLALTEAATTGVPSMPMAPVAGAARDESAKAAPQASGTNVQEAGVDEPDVVKTDGRRIVTVVPGTPHTPDGAARLQVLVVEDGRHRLAGSLALPGNSGGHDLLLSGDRVLVRSSTWVMATTEPAPDARGVAADMMIAPGQERTVLTLVDISDPEAPAALSTFEVDGHVLGARLVGDVARVVTGAAPRGFTPVHPTDGSAGEMSRVEAANQTQVEASSLRNWLPEYTLRPAPGTPAVSGLAVDCARVSHPAEFSGLGTISVLTFDLSEGLSDGDAVTVLADGQTVYASEDALYVATTRYPEVLLADVAGSPPPVTSRETTEIHKFDITGDGPARHVASGRVRGHLLNQFSMSEHEGRLRVATTDSGALSPLGRPSGAPASESFVTVLEERSGVLEQIGQVGGLGRGEQIYAVRFIGAVGYVVTFRQTDPLYTLDLSDPGAPRVVGELKIPGYSAYLHPVGDGLLLGVGQDATEEGRRTGAQVSLFDVSDPASPRRLDQVGLGVGSTTAEFDHHAFLWWAPRGLAVLPLQTYDPVPSSVAVGLSVDAGRGLGEAGRITHPQSGPGGGADKVAVEGTNFIQRSLVIGDALYTVSAAGILASDLGDLTERAWVGFPGA